MLSTQLISTIKPLVAELTPAQKLELIRWIVENPAEVEGDETPAGTWEAQISAEAAAWYACPEVDREPYRGQYVAVLHGDVIDHDVDQAALAQRVRARYPETPVLLTTAEARAPREFLMRSPRLERL
jgi:hypothetical protein